MSVPGGGRSILVALAALVGTSNVAGAEICVAVNYRFTGRGPSHALVRSMEHEVSLIWQQYGVRILWPSSGDGSGPVQASFDVLIQRRPQAVLTKSGAAVLGNTRIEPALIDHTLVQVDYGATERVLGLVTQERLRAVTGSPMIDAPIIGRALGRVLAHEIGHVLLAQPDHQPHGLMRRAFFPEDLAALNRPSFTLSPDEVARLRARERVIVAASVRVSSPTSVADRRSQR